MEQLDPARDLPALSGACYRGDARAIVTLLAGRNSRPLLQHAGIGLVVALGAGLEPAREPAREILVGLGERAWEGDAELAEHLTALLGGSPSGRRGVPAELDDLADLLEGSPEMGFGGLLDLDTGACWHEAALEDWGGDEDAAPDPEGEPDRWLFVPNVGSREAWRDMDDFAGTVDGDAGDQLAAAINGRGAFSRFRRTLDRYPDLIARWRAFSDERRIGRARSWLASEGYDALPPLRAGK